jgi:hypothetical protein
MKTRNPFPNPDRKRLLMTLLKMMGGNKVHVTFSGGGDSGSIESVSLLDSDGNSVSLENTMFEWESESQFHNIYTGNWELKRDVEEMPLADILTKICEDCLDSTDLDWYNNEGGQGQLTIDLTQDPPSIDLNVEINYTHTENHNFDFNDDEEEEQT